MISSTRPQQARAWQGGCSKGLSIACSLPAGDQTNPRRSLLPWPPTGTTLPPSPRIPPPPSPKPLSIPLPVRTSPRTATRIKLPADLGRVTLGRNQYYTPIAINNPLFDAFTVDHDPDNHTVVISIFQMTTSLRHEGSPKGYPHIQKIMARVYELLGPTRSDTTVKVAYFLVCPEGDPGQEWKMPAGWNRKLTRKDPEGYGHDHSGEVFRLPFPSASIYSQCYDLAESLLDTGPNSTKVV